jgi:hypothetical protein
MFVGCHVCGKASPQFGIGSTNAYGYADLDSRPPEMRRSTIGYWVHRCPVCGCCAADLETAPETARALVEASATRCRNEGVRLVRLVREKGLALTDQSSSDPAILADLLRRAGRFTQGIQEVDDALVHTEDETVRTLLRYQRRLLLEADRGLYTVEAALGAGK